MHAALENGPWLLGDRYTLADIIVAPHHRDTYGTQ
jgi:glutathione S-transferase